MAWCQIGDKPLYEPMPTWFTEVYMCGTRGRWLKGDQQSKLDQNDYIYIYLFFCIYYTNVISNAYALEITLVQNLQKMLLQFISFA